MMRLAAWYAVMAGQSDDLPALQQEACRIGAEGLEVDFAKLLAYQAADHSFLVQAGVGWRPGVVGQCRLEADTGTAAGFAWHTGQSVISNTLANDARFRTPGLLIEYGLTRSINIPVPGDGPAPIGVLEVESSQAGAFVTDDLCFLQLIVHSLSGAQNRLVRQGFHDEQATRNADERRLSLHEMQHRIRNDLQGICSSLDREARSLEGAKRSGYDRVMRRVVAVAALYDHLLGAQAGSAVEMHAYLNLLCLKIAAASDLASRNITLAVDAQPFGMAIDRAGRLAIAVNELVANAAEHAFPSELAGTITVRLSMQDAGCPVVSVSDDGCGFRGARPGSAGLGFVDRLVRGLGGVLTRVDGVGTEWRIALPS